MCIVMLFTSILFTSVLRACVFCVCVSHSYTCVSARTHSLDLIFIDLRELGKSLK